MIPGPETAPEIFCLLGVDKCKRMNIITNEQLFICFTKEGKTMAEERDTCEFIHVHEDIVNQVNAAMPDEEILYDLAELFKLFADSTRIKILYVLSEAEMCVCDIAQLLGLTQSAVSHQLRALKQSKLVKYRREGKTVFYSLADGHVQTILSQGMEHIAE